MNITAEMVRALREKTSLPMMECKKALVESHGDEVKALEWLRKAGLVKGAKMAERVASEGRVAIYVAPDGRSAGIAELRCETEPVAGTPDFVRLASAAAQLACSLDNPTPEVVRGMPLPDEPGRKLGDAWDEMFNRIREKMDIARVGSIRGYIGSYQHHNFRAGTVVALSGDCPAELRTDVCMHITWSRPPYLKREDVPAADVEQRRREAAEEAVGKPAQVIDKIVAGKLDRWFAEIVLLEQPFVKDDKRTVGQVLRDVSPSLTIERFLRYEVGTA